MCYPQICRAKFCPPSFWFTYHDYYLKKFCRAKLLATLLQPLQFSFGHSRSFLYLMESQFVLHGALWFTSLLLAPFLVGSQLILHDALTSLLLANLWIEGPFLLLLSWNMKILLPTNIATSQDKGPSPLYILWTTQEGNQDLQQKIESIYGILSSGTRLEILFPCLYIIMWRFITSHKTQEDISQIQIEHSSN